MSGASVGIDVGGTFTDLVSVSDDGQIETRKVLSTAEDQSRGVDIAIADLAAPGGSIERVVHGTTVVTNLLLERSGARVVLCATDGATDLLTLRRQERASLYDLSIDHPAPLAVRADTIPVAERIMPGRIDRPLDVAEARRVADRVADAEAEIVAVSLLHSYADDRHERLLACAIAERCPTLDVVLSCDVVPEIREYERTSTTVAEAYARPRVASYLRALADRLRSRGWPAPGVMTSSGGMREAGDAAVHAASLALSGPAGGVVGAAFVAREADVSLALTIDIGGTSADAGLIVDGEPLIEVGGAVAGVALSLPRVLVETVSAGGGSIGWIDEGGALRVGPRSAGARPGPAAFGRGGTEATVTDAHIVLGNIVASGVSGVSLHPDAARRAIGALARRLGADSRATSVAMLAAADAEMARALRRVGVERGIDPRRCTLIAFGGGGPLHGCSLADRLDIDRVLVPPAAGVLSALGLALAPRRREALASVMLDARDLTPAALGALLSRLASVTGRSDLAASWLRTRYRGQGHELEVAVEESVDGTEAARRFVELHARRFGFTLDLPVEIVSARHSASGRAGRARLMATDDRVVEGQASIALADATLLVSAGWRARSLPTGGWEVKRT